MQANLLGGIQVRGHVKHITKSKLRGVQGERKLSDKN